MPDEPKKIEETKKAGPSEKPTNCIKCNKHLKRKSWYYRNGGYYCSKGCWKQATSKQDKKKEA